MAKLKWTIAKIGLAIFSKFFAGQISVSLRFHPDDRNSQDPWEKFWSIGIVFHFKPNGIKLSKTLQLGWAVREQSDRGRILKNLWAKQNPNEILAFLDKENYV